MQSNLLTGNLYQGGNQKLLENAQITNDFRSDKWCTFLQAKQLGKNIVKGSRGVSIRKFVTDADDYNPDDNEIKKDEFRGIRYYTVFNEDQLTDN